MFLATPPLTRYKPTITVAVFSVNKLMVTFYLSTIKRNNEIQENRRFIIKFIKSKFYLISIYILWCALFLGALVLGRINIIIPINFILIVMIIDSLYIERWLKNLLEDFEIIERKNFIFFKVRMITNLLIVINMLFFGLFYPVNTIYEGFF